MQFFPITSWFYNIGRQSVDSLNGGFFTRDFFAVGRSGKKKKSHWLQTYPKWVLNCHAKHNYYGSNRKKWHLPPQFKGSYLSVGPIGGKIWHFLFFQIFGHFFFLPELFGVHRSIRHSRNQLTVALYSRTRASTTILTIWSFIALNMVYNRWIYLLHGVISIDLH